MLSKLTPLAILLIGSGWNAFLLIGAIPVVLMFGLFGSVAFASGPPGPAPAPFEVKAWMIAMLLIPVSLVAGTAAAWILYACHRLRVAYILLLVPTIQIIIVVACPIIVLGVQAVNNLTRASLPSSASDFDWLGHRHDREKNYRASVKDYSNEIKVSQPASFENMSGYLGRAHARVQLGDYGDAISDYKTYLALLPKVANQGDVLDEIEIMLSMGYTYCRWGHYDDAIAVCKKVEEEGQTRNALLRMLKLRAKVHEKMGQQELASRDEFLLDHYPELLKEYPSWSTRYYNIRDTQKFSMKKSALIYFPIFD